MKKLQGILVFFSALALLFVNLGCQQEKKAPKIGSVLRLSIGSEHGIPAKRGVQMAVDEFNATGGLNGQKVEVVFEDEKDSPKDAVNAVQKLINVDKVLALIGPMTSGSTLAAFKTADEAKVVFITPTATSPKVSGASPYLFRGCSRIDTQSKTLTDYIAEVYKPKTVAISILQRALRQGLRRGLRQRL